MESDLFFFIAELWVFLGSSISTQLKCTHDSALPPNLSDSVPYPLLRRMALPLIQAREPCHLPWPQPSPWLLSSHHEVQGEINSWMPSTPRLSPSSLPHPRHSHLSSCYYHLSSGSVVIFSSDLPAFILIHFTAYVLLHGILHRWSLIKYFYNHLIAVLSLCSQLCAPWSQEPSFLAHIVFSVFKQIPWHVDFIRMYLLSEWVNKWTVKIDYCCFLFSVFFYLLLIFCW